MSKVKAKHKVKSIKSSSKQTNTTILPKLSKKHSAPRHKNDFSGSEYKKELLEIDRQEDKFDKLFEQKLAAQYREFRNLKEHRNQTKRFMRIFIVLLTIILIALLLISF